MLQLSIVKDIVTLLLHLTILLTHQHHKIHKTNFLIILVYLYRTVEVGSIQRSLRLILTRQLQETRKLRLLYTGLQTIIVPVYLDRIINLLLSLLNYPLQLTVNTLHLTTPRLQLQRTTHPHLSLIIIYIVLHHLHIYLKLQRLLRILNIRHYLKISVRQVQKRLYLPRLPHKRHNDLVIHQPTVHLVYPVLQILTNHR
jgi:hypothetical protein